MKAEWVKPLLGGRTVVCIASGPSLTPEDCERVHAAGLRTIVTNTTFRLCPWADVLMAFDWKWWKVYATDVDAAFKGRRVTCSGGGRLAESMQNVQHFRAYGNSGTAAVSLAVFAGASRVVLLGCDAQATDGKKHWHGDHPPELSNARSIASWPHRFSNVAKYAKQRGVPVVNASRETALTCFQRVNLEEELQC